MEEFKPIRIPWKQRYREIRVRLIPLLMFLSIAGVVFYLWEERIQSPGMIGEVVAETSVISSPDQGLLTRFSINRFDEVRTGELIGEVVIAHPERVQAQMDIILSEIEVIKQSLDPVINEERNRLNIQNLIVDQMQQRISLAEARLTYRQSQADYNRSEQLFEQGLISEQEYELAQMELETSQVRVEQKEELIQSIEESLSTIRDFGDYSTDAERDPIAASIQMQERRLESLEKELEPRLLHSPASGVVSQVYHRSGEFIESGTRIIEIEAREPSYIIGYVRQPFTIQPEVGMQVEIRPRKPGRNFVISHISKLGGHITLIDNHLQRPGAFTESGLPVQIALAEDDDIQFTPGEIVDIVMHRR